MSEILANIVVEQTSINFSPDNNNLNITPEVTALNIFTGGLAVPGGNIGELQYNNGTLAGVPNVTFISGNLSLGNVANVKILGGSPNFALRTDGAGNLSWGDTANANYANFAGNAFAVAGANVSGTVANANTANYAAFAGNVTIAAQSNITSLGNLTSLNVVGTSNLSNVGNVKITGGTNGQYLQTDGTGNLSFSAGGGSGNGVVGGSNSQVQFNDAGNFGGSAGFTFNNSTNAAALTGQFQAGSVNSTPITTLPYGTEVISITTYTGNGTFNQSMLTTSITLSTANAVGNIILNLRGNTSVTANSLIANGTSTTTTYVMKTGSVPYTIPTFQIDGSNTTVFWVNGSLPLGTSNSYTSFTFTAIKTANTPSYTVFGSATRYA
jgi:hypothetical protein